MTGRDPLPDRTLAEVAGLIGSRAISPVDLTRSQLARIRDRESALHAYACVTEDLALDAARAAETEIAAGGYRGGLHGIPVAVKDLFFTKGVRTRAGLRMLAKHVPDRDAAAVSQLKDAGAVLVGKTQTTEGAMDGYHRDFVVPRNPWAADRWPGVSSSGSGVAVAAGLCYAALGTDTGGSVRIPAAANGVVGLKPTRGLVSTEGVWPLAPSLDHVGPMARSVGDIAIVMQALCGAGDPPTTIDGVRVGLDERLCREGVEPCQVDAVLEAVRVLERMGARVVPVTLTAIDEACRAWYVIAAAEAAHVHRDWFPSRAVDYGVGFRAFLERGRRVSPAEYAEADRQRAEWTARSAECFRTCDVLACPGLPGQPFRYDPDDAYGGTDAASGRSHGIPDAFLTAMDRLVVPFNLSGFPALAMPCGASSTGMPLGLQLIGRPRAEPLLIACGLAFERETEWHLRRPPA